MRFGRSWRRGVLWAALAVWGCGGGDEARESDADSGRGPTPDDLAGLIPDRTFPDFTEDDLVVNEVIGVRTVSERLLLGFEPDATAAQVADALGLENAEVEAGLPEGGVVLLRFPGASDAEVAAARERLSALPGVSGAAEIGVISALIAPRSTARSEGPYWSWSGQSWPIPDGPSAVNGTWALRTISAPNAWNLVPWLRARPGRTETPRVGVIDVDLFTHEDVDYTRVGNRRPPRLTGSPHGVMVMGTLGATWGNGASTDGVAPQVELSAVDSYLVDDELDVNGVATDDGGAASVGGAASLGGGVSASTWSGPSASPGIAPASAEGVVRASSGVEASPPGPGPASAPLRPRSTASAPSSSPEIG